VGSSARAFSSSSFLSAGSQSKTPPEQSDGLLDVGRGGLDIRSHERLLQKIVEARDSLEAAAVQWAATPGGSLGDKIRRLSPEPPVDEVVGRMSGSKPEANGESRSYSDVQNVRFQALGRTFSLQ